MSRRVVLITASLLVWSAVTLAIGVSRTYGQLVAARAVMGLSEACYLPAALARIAQHHGSRTRSGGGDSSERAVRGADRGRRGGRIMLLEIQV